MNFSILCRKIDTLQFSQCAYRCLCVILSFDFNFWVSKQTHSTWLDCSRWMSNNRPIHGKSARSFSETGRCACSYYIMQVHRFSNRLKPSLWGNKSKYPRFPIHSTLLLPEAILAFSVSGHRLNDPVLCHFTQQGSASCRLQIKHSLHIRSAEYNLFS